ncbi:aspartyl protease AED3-like [Olea europaea subsp. europaea]|uniref:Aspartyl protease AED3-like n=1 Tax=Olea europaea subsp. europaea TaxID=158383 RepID=A0A8S0UVN9_OLEEU|nr:aspartyl protease AED3-like [Olea europaea subsp. europaea]
MKPAMAKLLYSLAILLFSSVALGFIPNCNIPEQGSTLQVIHVNSPCSPFRSKTQLSWEDSVLQMQSEDKERLIYLSSLVAGRSIVPVASGRQVTQNPTYILRAKIGTPPQILLMAMDTSSDAAWVPCSGCVGCPTTAFYTAKSTSFKNLSCGAAQCKQVPNPSCEGTTCGFNLTYGSSSIAASLVQDTIRLATDIFPGYTFGCIRKATGNSIPAQGLLGLGRGPLSLLSQTQYLYKSTFSYCLPSYKSPNFSGSLRLGPNSQPIRIKYTQLLKNPRRSSLYYVNLVGIKVGRGLVKIPPAAFSHDPITGSGTVIDSGTVFTHLVEPAYIAVRDAFRRLMGKAIVSSLGGFDTCYTVPITVPTITFMFSGINMTLPQDNFLIRSVVGTTSCLAMAAAPTNVNSVLNVIANFQQQNHRILIDVPNSKLGVARETCT